MHISVALMDTLKAGLIPYLKKTTLNCFSAAMSSDGAVLLSVAFTWLVASAVVVQTAAKALLPYPRAFSSSSSSTKLKATSRLETLHACTRLIASA